MNFMALSLHCVARFFCVNRGLNCGFVQNASGVRSLFVILLAVTGAAFNNSADAARSVGRPASMQSNDMSSEAIQDAANRVMQRSDFRGVRRRVLENVEAAAGPDGGFLFGPLKSMGSAVSDFFDWLFRGWGQGTARVGPAPATAPAPPPPATGSPEFNFNLANAIVYLGLAVLIFVAIWIIASLLKKSDPNRRLNRDRLFGDDEGIDGLSTPPGELAASTYESRAIQLAAEGNCRAAIRELLIGSMSWIERAGLIRFRKGLTNRDYIRAVWKQSDKREAYNIIALEFERIYFGRRNATRDSFDNCLRSFQGVFREEETTTAAV